MPFNVIERRSKISEQLMPMISDQTLKQEAGRFQGLEVKIYHEKHPSVVEEYLDYLLYEAEETEFEEVIQHPQRAVRDISERVGRQADCIDFEVMGPSYDALQSTYVYPSIMATPTCLPQIGSQNTFTRDAKIATIASSLTLPIAIGVGVAFIIYQAYRYYSQIFHPSNSDTVAFVTVTPMVINETENQTTSPTHSEREEFVNISMENLQMNGDENPYLHPNGEITNSHIAFERNGSFSEGDVENFPLASGGI